jgi:hypothetical protein
MTIAVAHVPVEREHLLLGAPRARNRFCRHVQDRKTVIKNNAAAACQCQLKAQLILP